MRTLRIFGFLLLPAAVAAQQAEVVEKSTYTAEAERALKRDLPPALPTQQAGAGDGAKRITFTTDADRAAKHAAEVAAEAANRSAYFAYPVGKTFWYVPGPGMRTSFFQTFETSRYRSSVVMRDRFTPDVAASFQVLRFVPLESGDEPTYAYQIRFEDGTMGYLYADALGRYTKGVAPDSVRSGVTADPKATADQNNGKLFAVDPAELGKAYAVIAEQEKRDAERVLAEQAAARRQEEARAAKLRRVAASQPTTPKKSGVLIGMNQHQVLASSWGRPSNIRRTTGSYGTREQWIYGGSNYLYFDNGILTAIQN